jgi:hypothetical protein
MKTISWLADEVLIIVDIIVLRVLRGIIIVGA